MCIRQCRGSQGDAYHVKDRALDSKKNILGGGDVGGCEDKFLHLLAKNISDLVKSGDQDADARVKYAVKDASTLDKIHGILGDAHMEKTTVDFNLLTVRRLVGKLLIGVKPDEAAGEAIERAVWARVAILGLTGGDARGFVTIIHRVGTGDRGAARGAGRVSRVSRCSRRVLHCVEYGEGGGRRWWCGERSGEGNDDRGCQESQGTFLPSAPRVDGRNGGKSR